VKSFFASIRHDMAKETLKSIIADPKAYDYVCKVIDSFGGDVGIGLGSQISQLIALSVLNRMDHWIKDDLRTKYYLRYMDDFYIIHHDKEYLKLLLEEIDRHLQSLGLRLNPKTTIYPLKQGLTFLKWKFVLTPTGKVYMRDSSSKAGRRRRKLTKLYDKEVRGELPEGTAAESLRGYLAHQMQGDTYNQRRNLIAHYKKEKLKHEGIKC